MTEGSEIEAEARAYVEAYRDVLGGKVGEYLIGLVDALDEERKAYEITLTVLRDTVGNMRAEINDERRQLNEARAKVSELAIKLAERDAEIAELTGIAGRDHGHNEPCMMCGKPCDSLAGNPSLWAVRLGNDGWRHGGCVNDALRELARLNQARNEFADRAHDAERRLRAPPGADVRVLAHNAARAVHHNLQEAIEHALQQYGDERTAALQAVISEAYQVVGALSHSTATFDHPDVIRALDNLAAAADGKAVPHDDLLPFPKQPIRPDIEARAREVRAAAIEEAAHLRDVLAKVMRLGPRPWIDGGPGVTWKEWDSVFAAAECALAAKPGSQP